LLPNQNQDTHGQMSTKRCSHCKQELPATTEFFYKHPTGTYGLDHRCIPCNRLYKIGLHKAHKNPNKPPRPDCCPICKRTDRPLWLDHDRVTGEIFGWLCPNCNTHNGWLKEYGAAINEYNNQPTYETIN